MTELLWKAELLEPDERAEPGQLVEILDTATGELFPGTVTRELDLNAVGVRSERFRGDEFCAYYRSLGDFDCFLVHGAVTELFYLVSPADACPDCGERRQDTLIWHDDEFVECQTCGYRYLP